MTMSLLWVYFTCNKELADGSHVRPSFCHPHIARARMRHIKERYGIDPDRVERLTNNHIDLGGMIFVGKDGDEVLKCRVGKERTISCFRHQVSDVHSKLKLAGVEVVNGRKYRRFGRWPGVVVFISESDWRKFVRFLEVILESDQSDHVERREKIVHVLAGANKISIEEQRRLEPPKPTVEA